MLLSYKKNKKLNFLGKRKPKSKTSNKKLNNQLNQLTSGLLKSFNNKYKQLYTRKRQQNPNSSSNPITSQLNKDEFIYQQLDKPQNKH